MNDYTVEVYKQDRRTRAGERLVEKHDYRAEGRHIVESVYTEYYPVEQGFRLAIHETFVTRTNIITGLEFQERYDTPYFCSPSSESFWAN